MRNSFLFLILLYFSQVDAEQEQCSFPQSSVKPFYFELASDVQPGTVVVDTKYEPPEAQPVLASIRSDSLPDTPFSERFSLENPSPGRLILRTVTSMALPAYPSPVNKTTLYITVVCNQQAFPLMTVRIVATNAMSPQFYHEPYILKIDKTMSMGTVVDTSVTAVDWDPSPVYPIQFKIEGQSPFEVAHELNRKVQMSIEGSANWPLEQMISVVRLRLVKPLPPLPTTIRIVAYDNAQPPRTSSTIIRVEDYKMLTTDEVTEENNEQDGKEKESEEDPTTTTATTTKKMKVIHVKRPKTKADAKLRQEFRAHASKIQNTLPVDAIDTADFEESEKEALAPLKKTTQTRTTPAKRRELKTLSEEVPSAEEEKGEEPVTRFKHCSVRVKIPENSPIGTFVTRLEILNRQRDTHLSLLDPDGTFALDSKTGDLKVNDNSLLDREMFSTLEVVAQIDGISHGVLCGRVRIKVDLQDLNDNRPTFEKEKYWIHLDRSFPVGREVMTLIARDIDDAENGQISYRLITPDVPFQVRTKGKDCVITSTGDISGESEYHLTVEARDYGDSPKSAQVPVDIFILQGAAKKKARKLLTKASKKTTALARGVINTENDIEPISTTTDESEDEEIEPTTAETRTTRRYTPRKTTRPVPLAASAARPQEIQEGKRSKSKANSIEKTDNESPSTRATENTDEKFTFKEPSYYYEALGDVQENDILGRVVADGAEMFAVERKFANLVKVDETGELLAAKSIGEQPTGNHSIKISATNGFATTSTVVTLAIDRERRKEESKPQFDQSIYRFRTAENEPPAVLGYVRAFHPSVSSSSSISQLTYSLLSSDPQLPFTVDPLSGEIITKISLDYEKQSNYNFKVRACLSTYAASCGLATILVTVDDINDNPPKFSTSIFQTAVPSDLPIGSQVYQMQTTDEDSGANGQITYTISPPSAIFAVDVNTGKVVTLQTLTESFYSILVEAFDNGVPRKSDIAELRISVHGTNPSAPVFEKETYDVMLNGPIRTGQVVAEVRATDPDPGQEGKVTYRLPEDSNSETIRETFSINENTGAISALRVLTEKDGPVDLKVEAVDGSVTVPRSAASLVHLEILGDNSLHFLPLPTKVYISTEKAVGSVVLRASASTVNKQPVRFRVLEENSQFAMDGDLLRVANHLREGTTTLTIRAESGDAKADHQLKVVVMADRDKYPVFPQLTYDIDIARNSHFPLIVHRFEARLQNGSMQYSFFPRKSQPKGVFVDERTGDLMATEDFVKDKSVGDTTFIVIRAINMDFSQFYSDVGVAITVVETQAPVRFSLPVYRLEVLENTPVGTIVGQLQLLNVAAPVVFSIVPNSVFGVNPNGSVFVQNNIDLESLPVDNAQLLNFVVTANVNGDQATARIQVHIGDMNEFRPEFKERQITLKMRASAPTGSVLGKVEAIDGDRSEKHLNYRIVSGSGKDYVFIQEDGTILLAERKPGQAPPQSFDLVVEAADRNGNKDQMSVFVEVGQANDHVPRFDETNITWNITKTTVNQFFIHVTDEDESRNGRVQLRIVAGNEEGHFELVTLPQNTGRIQVVKPFDASVARTFILTVEARDSGDPALFTLAPVTINVVGSGATSTTPPVITEPGSQVPSSINHAPVFSEQTYSISLRPGQGPELANVVAQDQDGDVISYSIEPPEYRNIFSIDNHGRLSLRVSDSELQQSLYSFLVIAEDNGNPVMSAFVNVKLQVLKPATRPQPARTTSSQTVEPSVRPSTIQVVEGESRASTTRPAATTAASQDIHFTLQEYRFATKSDASFGSIVGNVELNELPPGSPVDYSFVSTSRLSIDADGTVRTAQNMAGEETIDDIVLATQDGKIVAESRILVNVEQLTSSSRSTSPATRRPTTSVPASPSTTQTTAQSASQSLPPSTQTTSVSSTTLTLTSPESFAFRRPVYFGFMPEGNYSQGVVVDLKPESLSTNYNGKVTYEIANRGIPMPFFMTEDGQLIIFDADREKQTNFMFDIIARKDGKTNGEVARASINVTILDVNDSAPQFPQHRPVIGLSKETSVGSAIVSLSASDKDADVNAKMHYELEGAGSYFSVDEEGTIRVANALISAPDEMDLQLTATDGGMPAKSAQTKLHLRLFDPLMPSPHLQKELPEMVVPEGAKPGTVINSFVVGPENSTVQTKFKISDNSAGLFAIDKNGELILARRPMSNEVNKYHQLNVTAENRYGSDWTTVNVFVEGHGKTTVVPGEAKGHCRFDEKIYTVNVKENSRKRTRLTKVTSNCEREHKLYRYSIAQDGDNFEIDANTGEVWSIKPLDKEKQAVYLIYVTVVEQQSGRVARQSDAAIQQAAQNLQPSQCLVVVRVTDENDNGPQFMHLNANGVLVGTISYNADPLTAVARLEARDPDTSSQVKYSLSGEDAEYFMVNEETGVVMLAKSIDANPTNEFRLIARATDGQHNVEAPFSIYKLSPDSNLVQLTGEMPSNDVNEEMIAKAVSESSQAEGAVLVKQPYIDQNGKADPNKSLIYVYATNPLTQKPYSREELQKMLEAHAQQLRANYGVSSIDLLNAQGKGISAHSLLLLLIAIIAVAIILLSICLLILCFKRREGNHGKRNSEGEYMVDTTGVGPRPYDVESITRQTAQKVLAGRPLPEPLTETVEVAVSPAFMDRSESSREFSNAVIETTRPSLLQSALQRQKVHAIENAINDKDKGQRS